MVLMMPSSPPDWEAAWFWLATLTTGGLLLSLRSTLQASHGGVSRRYTQPLPTVALPGLLLIGTFITQPAVVPGPFAAWWSLAPALLMMVAATPSASPEPPSQGTEAGQPPTTTAPLRLDDERDPLDLTTSLDAILAGIRQLVPYDVAEITLWRGDRQYCETQGWAGDRSYVREGGGIYHIDEGYTGWIIRHRRMLHIPDVPARRDVRPLVDSPDFPFQSYIGIPLQIRGRFVGTLELVSYRRDAWTEQEIEILQAISNQAAVAIENAHLYAETRRRASELASLAAVSAAVSESLDLEHVLQAIVSAVLDVVHCERSAIFVLDESQQVLRLAMTKGLSAEYTARSQVLTLEVGGRAHAVATGKPLIVSDVGEDENLLAYAPMSRREGFRAFADLPLKRADRVIGMLSAMFVEPHRFSATELELLTAFADQAAIAIENARLYSQTDEQLRRQVEALSALQRVSREVNATLDLDHILNLVLEEAAQLGQVTHGAVLLRDSPEEALRLEVCTGYDDEEEAGLLEMLNGSPPHPALTRVLNSQESLLVRDTLTEGIPGFGLRTRSFLLVPIFYREGLVGLILLESTTPNAFDRGMQEFVEGLSAQTATAIGNAWQYREQLERGELLRRRADQLAAVLEVSRALHSDRPLEEILEEVAYAIQESVGFDLVLVSVVEGDPPYRRRVAAAGIPVAAFEEMKKVRQPWSVIADLMAPEFRISQSYYIPAEHQAHWRGRVDVYEEETGTGIAREPGKWHPHDLLLVPLIGSEGDVQGLLSVDQPRDGKIPDWATIRALEIFASQAAIAVENARLVETLRRRAETLALFNEVSRSATAKLELDAVLKTVVEVVPRLIASDRSSIFLLDAASGRYIPRAAYGFSLETLAALTFAPGEGLVGVVAETRQPLAVDDVRQDPHFIPFPQTDVSEIVSSLLVPLIAGEQVIGILCADRTEKEPFSASEMATLAALADQVAVAVENARLFDEVRRFSQELEQRVEERTRALADAMERLTQERDRVEILYTITSQLASSLDLDRVLNRALELAVKAVGAERAAILMVEQDSGRLIYRAALGTDRVLPPGGAATRFSRGEGLGGWVVEHREAVIVSDVLEDERWVRSLDNEEAYRSALAVPLISGDEVQGVLLLFHSRPDHFDSDHLLLVEAAAIQVANAIGNAELYGLIRDQAARLGDMLKTQQVEAAKSQAILEGVADGVIVADADGRVILFNAAAERILALPREEALGKSTDDLLDIYRSKEWTEAVARWAEPGMSYAVEEYLAARLEIGDRIVSVHLAPVLMRDEFLGTVSVFRDVTAEVQAERAKTEFVSMVSHELRTPMTSIKGYVDLLLMGAAGFMTEDAQRFLKIVSSNVDRLTILVNDLLDISRIESGRMKIEPQPMRVEEVIEQVIAEMEARAIEKRLTLTADVPADLPPVYADPDRVTQVLANLVANACHYTLHDGRVNVSAARQGEMVRITVEDTGIGIAPEDIDRVFDRFFRADDPVVQNAPGTGLGLSIVKSLVEMQGGEVSVESELGRGSKFTFTIPVYAPA